MKKIMTIVGARPQFVKATVVSQALVKKKNLREIIVHTGQHYDSNMSQIFFDELNIPEVSYHLNVGSGSQAKQTADILIEVEKVLIQEQPDLVLIYGDTNSTLAAALAAAKLHIPIAHVEAGLRSYNRKMPEEVNRLVADQLAEILFTPTTQAIANLKQEGFSEHRIIPVGDVMYDAAIIFAEKAQTQSQILEKNKLHAKQYILATIHRAENTDDPRKLANIFAALERICETLPIVLPLHPRTKKAIDYRFPDLLTKTKINIIDPVGFLDMLMLEKNAALIITDSGGVQKEAFFYQVPCITLREETEWVETVQLNWNNLVKPDDANVIYQQTIKHIGAQGKEHDYPYGKGNASELIATFLSQGEN